MLLQVKQNITI